MELLNHADIIAKAREMRAEEIQRVQGVVWNRTCLLASIAVQSLAGGITSLAELIRPFFSWNPQEHRHS